MAKSRSGVHHCRRYCSGSIQHRVKPDSIGNAPRALARGYGEVDEAQAAATRTAQTYNLSQTEANKQFANLYGRLRPLGLRVGQIEDAFGGTTAAKNSGLDAAGSATVPQVCRRLVVELFRQKS